MTMMKKSLAVAAVFMSLALGVTDADAARLTVRNGHRYPIHVSALREGNGDTNVWHGHRRWRELNRWLDMGMLHSGESKTFDLETGKWQVQTSNKRTGPRAEVAQVRLRSQRGAVVNFQ